MSDLPWKTEEKKMCKVVLIQMQWRHLIYSGSHMLLMYKIVPLTLDISSRMDPERLSSVFLLIKIMIAIPKKDQLNAKPELPTILH